MAARKDARRGGGSRRRLGRGLESLLSSPVQLEIGGESTPSMDAGDAAADTVGDTGPSVVMLTLDAVQPNPDQPRRHFDEEGLRNLAQSIRTAGVMQPIVVRPKSSGGFEIVAGERRWRAAMMIQLPTIPAVVRNVDDRTAAEWSLVENLQREDLNPIERGEAFQRLAEEYRFSHQEIAERVGLDRSSVTNHVRLTELDEQTKEAVRGGVLSMGHGRAVLAITNIEQRQQVVRRAVQRGWSVRELERRVRALTRSDQDPPMPPAPLSPRQAQIEDLQRRLGEHLGTKVQIRPGRAKGAGQLLIAFYSLDEFEGILRRLGFSPE